MKLQIVGGGKMGEALLGGLLASGWAKPEDLGVIEPSQERRTELTETHSGVVVTDSVQPRVDAVIAVKPQQVVSVVDTLAEAHVSRLLSIAAGVTIGTIEASAPNSVVVRAMPNTPALVREGASAIAGGSKATDADLEWAQSILDSVGLVVRVDEVDLDAVTGLSGSGPAYVFRLLEGLIAAGISEGLAPDVATALAGQTVLGAATLFNVSGEDPAVLRENVTSPGGTTAAGLAVFDEADLVGLIGRVVRAAAERSRELGA